ncbi:MAG: S-layer homology domain-containing protein [Cyanobacteria bacterium P01_D01_bin.1]
MLSLVLSGCAGSGLGDRLGRSLEPDPQLAERAEGADGSDAVADEPTSERPPVSINPVVDTSEADSEEDDSATATEPDANPSTAANPTATAGDYTDIGKAPEEIRLYLRELLELELLKVRPPLVSAVPEGTTPPPPPKPNEFRPNQATTRREYARWLLAVNNRFYQSNPNRRIRAGVTSSQPVFQDVPISDPDFAAIQGLAEAGIIPSPLTGSSTTLTFRPDAPLTRKDLLLWKVPLDTRQPLPSATTESIQQAWGFQDADKVEPRVSQALLADYQLGDFSNIRRTYGYTTLFQPDKAATRSEAAAVLWRFGNPTEGITATEILNPTAETNRPNSTDADSIDNE